MYITQMGNTPVDIAGFCGHAEVVLEFCKHVEMEIRRDETKVFKKQPSAGLDEEAGNKIVPSMSATINGFNQLKSELKKDQDGKIVIECNAIKRQDLNYEETMQMRVFYWAAYHGLNRYLKYMILHKKWSPYIKSFKNRSIVSGAIWGENLDTIKLLVGDYTYTNVS